VLDLFWIFAAHGAGEIEAEAPLCLLDSAESAWMTTFLKPVLEASGYRVTAALRPGEVPRVLVRMEGDAAPATGTIPVVRLRRDAEGADDTIFRYDRPAVLAAVARSAAGGR
jgi:two-component system, chemotaxis family, sensor kinase CheA